MEKSLEEACRELGHGSHNVVIHVNYGVTITIGDRLYIVEGNTASPPTEPTKEKT